MTRISNEKNLKESSEIVDKGIDIVIPIYNAYDDLKICLGSVYKYTDLNKNRLILINDNSSDKRIKSYLNSKQKDNVIIIHNDENKGFSTNVNIGMAQSEHRDVILLNSDTVVTKSWVDKIVHCAYSDSSIGTVTPLSNNATLCSVPNFCEENSLPKGMTIDQVAEIVEECSLKKYPRITVAHGFCMFIKREVINTIGKFDAETFGKGYGEENDFCNRAEQMGYIHVMCDDTYIFHSGTRSFISEEKAMYIAEHEKILNKRYPNQMRNNELYCRDNPNGWIGYNIGFHIDINNGKKNILFLLQSDFEMESNDYIGGVQIHVKNLVSGIKNDANIFVVTRIEDYLKASVYIGDKKYEFRFWVGKMPSYPIIRDRELANVFANILEGFNIDLVHIHHTLLTSLDIFNEASKRNIPIVYSVHDFYSICPNQVLTETNGESCIGKSNLQCERCLNATRGVYEGIGFLEKWRLEYAQKLDLCKLIVAPSEAAKKIFCQYYPSLENKLVIIEHGVENKLYFDFDLKKPEQKDDLKWKIILLKRDCGCYFIAAEIDGITNQDKVFFRITDSTNKKMYLPANFGSNKFLELSKNRFFGFIPSDGMIGGKLRIDILVRNEDKIYINENIKFKFDYVPVINKDKIKIAFIGGINKDKGSENIIKLMQKSHQNIEWYIFGGIGDQNLFNLKNDNLIKTSFYYPEDIGLHLKNHNIDIICLLSKAPETFSYTLSEAIQSRIPVIVTNIGALGERCTKNKYGWVVSNNDTVNEVLNIINKIILNRKILEDQKQYLKTISLKSVFQMVNEYQDQYELFFGYEDKIKYIEKEKNMEFINKANINTYSMLSEDPSGNMFNCARIDRELCEYRRLQTTLAYKIILKVQKMNFPYKEKLRQKLIKLIN